MTLVEFIITTRGLNGARVRLLPRGLVTGSHPLYATVQHLSGGQGRGQDRRGGRSVSDNSGADGIGSRGDRGDSGGSGSSGKGDHRKKSFFGHIASYSY